MKKEGKKDVIRSSDDSVAYIHMYDVRTYITNYLYVTDNKYTSKLREYHPRVMAHAQ